VVDLVRESAHAFPLTASVYFQWSAPISTNGLDPATSLTTGNVFLIDVDPSSPSYGKRSASKPLFVTDGGPYGAPNLLAVLPFPGISLLPSTRYAAVVMRAQNDASGQPLCPAPAMSELVSGTQPTGMSSTAFAEYQAALHALEAGGIDGSEIAALAVYTTDNPVADFVKVRNAMQALPVPTVAGAWQLAPGRTNIYPTYCLFANTIPMPEYQGGTPPYNGTGGRWVFDAAGNPVLQRQELANIVVTVPRTAMPANGFPIVNMSRTGAGGNTPIVDRGQEAQNGPPSITPGTGPALYFAAAGFAGASIDGPLGGLRNPVMVNTDDDEDNLVFNFQNPGALRDNLRQSAAELSLTASILAGLSFDASSCPGVTTPDGGPVHFDATKMALFSHSMGSTISPLALAYEPRYKVAILSGAGGSYIENIIYKLLPLPPLRGADELLVGINVADGYYIGEGDPIVNMFQWAAESADPPVYDSLTIQHPVGAPARSVFKVQGIIDHYILPPICNATTLSLGLDLAGPELDTEAAYAALGQSLVPAVTYTPFEDVMNLSGRGKISLPAAGNFSTDGGSVTAIVVQHPGDAIEDGHEVIFQTDPPKHEYYCLLQSFAAGQPPRVPAPTDAGVFGPCQ
jgi:hypothetical protein